MRAVPRTVTSDAEFNQFLAALWEPLGASIPARELEIPCQPGSPDERSMVQRRIDAGETNENLLANDVFFARHPERHHRLISREWDRSNFSKVSQEWICIRDTLVRPLLRGTTSSQPAPPASTGPAPSPGGGYGLSGLGQPVAMPHVTKIRFRSARGTMTDPDNCCKDCPTVLGVGRKGTASNGMEFRFTLKGHRPGMKYEITRTRRHSVWQRRAGVWTLLSTSPSGTDDDRDKDDECLSPQNGKFIFVTDAPGWRGLKLPSPAVPLETGKRGVTTATDAQDIVMRVSFVEGVMARHLGEGIPWTPLALPPLRYVATCFYVLWHSTIWLIRDSADRLVLDRSRSSIGLGSLSEQIITTPPA